MTEPRGIRSNNPLNIEHNSRTQWQGLDEPPTDGRFCRFIEPQWGLRAGIVILRNYQKRGLTTLLQMISTWAPANENNPDSYAASVAKKMGIGVHDRVDLTNKVKTIAMLKGMVRVECGPPPAGTANGDWLDDSVYESAWSLTNPIAKSRTVRLHKPVDISIPPLNLSPVNNVSRFRFLKSCRRLRLSVGLTALAIFRAGALAPAQPGPLPPTPLPAMAYTNDFFPGSRYRPNVPTQQSIVGFANGQKAASAAESSQCLRAWAQAALERTHLVEYARSHENRPLHYLLVTAPENMSRLEEIRLGLAKLGDPRTLATGEADALLKQSPAVAWPAARATTARLRAR